MKCLSLTQPWASLVALGAKKVETRSWSTSYRGPLAIHASKGFPRESQDLCREEPFRTALIPLRQTVHFEANGTSGLANGVCLPLGFIVAVCELVRCIYIIHPLKPGVSVGIFTSSDGKTSDWLIDDREYAFGDYTPGRFMWLLSNVRALPNPIPAKGRLGLWETDLYGQSPVEAAAPAILAAAALDGFNRSKRG